jgi:hypothetical protein
MSVGEAVITLADRCLARNPHVARTDDAPGQFTLEVRTGEEAARTSAGLQPIFVMRA